MIKWTLAVMMIAIACLPIRGDASILLPPGSCENALAGIWLEYPLKATYYVKDKERSLDLAKMNTKLKAAGEKPLPEKITVGLDSAKFFEDLSKRIEAAQELWPQELTFNVDRAYLNDLTDICYHGNPLAVMKLLDKMSGKFFHDEQGHYAYRVGKIKKVLDDDNFGPDSELHERFPDHPETVDDWLNYDKKSSVILVISNWGPQGDGTELLPTWIPRCPSI